MLPLGLVDRQEACVFPVPIPVPSLLLDESSLSRRQLCTRIAATPVSRSVVCNCLRELPRNIYLVALAGATLQSGLRVLGLNFPTLMRPQT